MSDVDYREFYVKFGSHNNKKTKKQSKRSNPPDPKPERAPRRKPKSAVFTVAMILVCFALTFALAGILNRNGLKEVFGKKDSYIGYALVSEVKEGTEKGLNELSKFVRAGGGGGNVILKSGKYYVVHAVYLEKKDAQTVQARDQSSEIFGLEDKPFATDYAPLTRYAKRYNAIKAETIRSLYDAILENAKTEDNDLAVKKILTMKEPFRKLKDDILSDKSVESTQTLSIIVAIDTISGKLESLTTASASRISLLSDMRYQLFSIATNV